tara:strand:+ start:57588 stop:58031 length:444 start_codon:yes stop_codon:yes gene_type:complete
MSYLLVEFNTFKKETQKLSGIALLVDGKICLVLPKKFKNSKKYSIPKGHIESNHTPYLNAYIELKEETGIDIGKQKIDFQFNYKYKKNGILKRMKVFVIKMTIKEYQELNKIERNKKEIKKVKFVSKKRALTLVETKFKNLIRHIYI